MTAAAEKPLAWSLRERMLAALRIDLTRHAHAPYLAEVLAETLERLMRGSGDARFRRLRRRGVDGIPFAKTMEAWVAEMPATHRAEWLVDHASNAGGVSWAAEPSPVVGAILFPRGERDRIVRRLERLRERNLRREDDEPDSQQYADELAREMERLGRRHDPLDVRWLTRRFADRAGAPTLTFREALDRRKLPRPEEYVRFFERQMGIEWTDPARAPVVAEARPYAPAATYVDGDLVVHPRFGLGTVTHVEDERVRIRFPDGEKTLARRR